MSKEIKEQESEQVDHIRVLEALLFASPDPLSASELHERMPDGADVGGLLLQLQETYETRGVHLLDIEGKWAFRTAKDLSDYLNIEKQVQKKLSRAAMETLAIIAYHQPVTRAEIENIRGVATHRGTLDVLMEMGWVKPGRRRESLGRPLTWVTSNAFLDHFTLESLMDLPGMDEMKASGLLDRRPAIQTVGNQDDLFSGQKTMEGVEGLTHVSEGEDSEVDDEDYSLKEAKG